MSRLRFAFLLLQIGIFLLGISGSIYAALTPANSMGNPYMLLESDTYRGIFFGRVQKIGAIHGGSNFTLYRYIGSQ